MNQVFIDENQAYQFDFSAALYASDQLNKIYHQCKLSILSDVDFIVETDDVIILIEYKNACIAQAVRPSAFDPMSQKKKNSIAYKFYDTWIYLSATHHKKPVKYVYVLEYPGSDKVTRKMLRNKISNLLPFKLQNLPQIKEKLIHDFEVLSINEWNTHKLYRLFPITPLYSTVSNHHA